MSLAAPHILSCSPHSLCCCCCPAAGLFYYQCDISSAQTSPASLFLSSSPSTPSQSVTEQTLCYRAGESAVALHSASERHPAPSSHSALGDLEYCDLHRHDWLQRKTTKVEYTTTSLRERDAFSAVFRLHPFCLFIPFWWQADYNFIVTFLPWTKIKKKKTNHQTTWRWKHCQIAGKIFTPTPTQHHPSHPHFREKSYSDANQLFGALMSQCHLFAGICSQDCSINFKTHKIVQVNPAKTLTLGTKRGHTFKTLIWK